jgi:hypothetical protein
MRAPLSHQSRWTIVLLILAGWTASVEAVQVGQSREAVIKELGAPSGKMAAAGTEILRYPELTIKLKNGRVTAIDPYVPPPPRPVASSEAVTLPEPSIPHMPAPPMVPALPRTMPQYSTQKVELTIPKHFVGTPSIETSKGWMIAGTAFLVRRNNDYQVYVLTAHHLFSPLGGMKDTITHAQLPNVVRGFQLLELFGEAKTRPIEGCRVPDGDDPNDPIDDLALFKTNGVSDDDAPLLAETLPSPGESVWIIAKVQAGAPKGALVHKARVILHPSKWLVCVYENPQIVPNGAGGAPVFNADSRVVGMVSGQGEANGQKYAFIIPSPLIQKTIRGL